MAKKRDEDKLIFLLPEETSKQLDRIFEQFAEDKELRTQFVNDPANTLKKLGIDVPPDIDVSLVNRVIFQLMGDEKFIAWSHSYNEELRARYGDTIALDGEIRETITYDVDVAIQKHLPSKLRAEYKQAGGVVAYSFFAVGIAVIFYVAAVFTVAIVFNAALAVNVAGFWNVVASTDHMVGFGGSGGKAWGGADG